ncbi:hypothetical protein LQZ18_16640 [Lachnospiraceae bacterium ZAX-1]
MKVNRYIEEHKNHIVIEKLRKNMQLTKPDYQVLERILTGELGTKEDYKNNFLDTPFGLLVRKIAKLDRAVAMREFSAFIETQKLTSNQIVFVEKIIDYVVQNGYMETVAELTKPPFDKPIPFIKLFEPDKQKEVARIVNGIRENAEKIVG